MAVMNNKRSNMTLYVDKFDINSHRIKIVVSEKSVPADIIEVDPASPPEELLKINPYGTLPTLVDRDLVLYEPSIIAEYLDERFPHPPLLPVYPIARAKTRLMMLRIEREWYSLVNVILTSKNESEIIAARKSLTDSILSFAPVFASMPFFLSEEFSLLDCCIAPLLWQLPRLGITLPTQAKAVHVYLAKISERPSFKTSLSAAEREYA
ncbi:MAG TPA: glutathione S-transferase N-terminal domain-containing protein [Gammaproteobacteria bacterium]|nr:glutathione S-transferase N-terminal domain-containing protein [Gammaproteobacteria bacterium]